MKLFHLSDLHLGKRVNEFSMLEDQSAILSQILSLADEHHPDAVCLAGDIYDKPIPSAEAVRLFDGFLCALAERKLPAFIISGNHDSPERLSFGGRLMDASGIHFAPLYDGAADPITLEDEFGPVRFHMLPFVKPIHVRTALEDDTVESYTDAVRAAIGAMQVNFDERNVLITHQFVTGASRCESEELSVGGSDNVDSSVFDGFDYVALGHIHSPQAVGSERIRYSGTLLKYSFSEAGQDKSVTLVTLGCKGELNIEALPLRPLRDLREMRGHYMDLAARINYEGSAIEDYLHITLTDEEDIPEAISKLRAIYPNLMRLDYDNKRTRAGMNAVIGEADTAKMPGELFAELYEKQNGQPMSGEQQALIDSMIEEIWGGEQ